MMLIVTYLYKSCSIAHNMHEPTVKIDRGLIKGVIQVLNSVNFNYKPCVKAYMYMHVFCKTQYK